MAQSSADAVDFGEEPIEEGAACGLFSEESWPVQSGGPAGRPQERIDEPDQPVEHATGQKLVTLAVIGFGAVILLVVTVLVLDLTGRWRRAASFRWQGVGLLLVFGAVEARGIAMLRGWPGSRLNALGLDTFPVMMAGFALLLVGVFVQARSRRSRADGPSDQ